MKIGMHISLSLLSVLSSLMFSLSLWFKLLLL